MLADQSLDVERSAKAYLTTLQSYCRKLTGSCWDAEDLAQDTFVKAFAKLTYHENPKAYLFHIAKNTWIDRCRKRSRTTEVILDEKEAGAVSADVTETMDAMSILIRRLTPLQRVVFLLRDVFDLSSSEAAHYIGVTEGAVKAALHRARNNLKQWREAETREEMTNEAGEAENVKDLLHAYLAAFRSYDIEALVLLAHNDVIHPVQALNSLWASVKLQGRKQTRSSSTSDSTIQLMAA